MKVLVGISGGVDSAVAAHIIKSQGNEIVGAMMKIYSGGVKNNLSRSCYGSDKTSEIQDAKSNCSFLGCDFSLVNVSGEFDELVFKKFKSEYMSARTPNPCVICNPVIKFGVFPQKAKQMGIVFDKFATGHYVRNEFDDTKGYYVLKRGLDLKKDQSYFLYSLKQSDLENILFPLGSMTKDEVRDYAMNMGIPVAQKRDSQDFYAGSYSDLFDDKGASGDIVDLCGNILGAHSGLQNYTIGQRKGLLISYSEPLYVVGFDLDKNQLIVSTKNDTYSNGLIASNLNWISGIAPDKEFRAQIKIRSSQQPFNCTVFLTDNNSIRVEFEVKQSSVAPGQAAVLYDGDKVLGGGTIDSSF